MNVGEALRNTSKGQLKYDLYWLQQGRTQEIVDYASEYASNVSINTSNLFSSKSFSQAIGSISEDTVKVDANHDVSPSKSNPNKSSEKSRNSDSYYYELQAEAQQPIIEYEEGRLKYITDTFKTKKDEFEGFSNNLKQQTDQQYNLSKRNKELYEKTRTAAIKKIEEAIIAEMKEKERLQKQEFQTRAKKLSAIKEEAELKRKKAEEELQKSQQEQQEFAQQLNNCKLEVENLVQKTKQKLAVFEYPSYLKIPIDDRMNQLANFVESINTIGRNVESQALTIEDVSNAYVIFTTTFEFLQDVTNDIEISKVAALQDHEKKLLESRISTFPKESNKLSSVSSESAIVNPASMMIEISQDQKAGKDKESSKSKISSQAKAVLSGFIAPDVIEDFYKIKENLKAVKDCVQPFVDDPKNKKYRFELQKSINVPINAISSVSGSHVRDKIMKLLSILGTKVPNKEMANDYIVYNFCANLIARKFVEQSDKQISAQHSTAFPIALAAVGVWIKKPEVGSLILAHFYENCPYLVPYYPPPKENQSDQEYYESLGYYFDKEGNMEAQYKFLNRMSGFMRFYASILLSPVPPSSNKYSHPHGIAHAWRWLSRVLNMDPRPDITATLLYDFLDVTGNMLQKTYGNQFKKLLHIICKDYFQKIKRVTSSGSLGPVERLETFLQQTVKKGYIPPPEGILDSTFWNR